MSPEDEADEVLLARFRAADWSAAEALHRRYAARLRAVAESHRTPDLAARVDADDIVQSVFRTFFRRSAAGQYQVPAGEELWHLLVAITVNKAHSAADRHHAGKRDSRRTKGGDALGMADEAGGADVRAYHALRLLVADLIGGLPEAQQRMVRLRLEGNEVAEIAELTARSKRTVERVLQSFRSSLREQLDATA